MSAKAYRGPLRMSVRYSKNAAVQEFIEDETWAGTNPYNPRSVKSCAEIFAEARAKFGDMAMWDAEIWIH
jgi:hypothetical protein